MSEQEAYFRKMEAMLQEWPERISFLAERADAASIKKKADYDALIIEMNSALGVAEDKLKSFGNKLDQPEARKDLEKAWQDLAGIYEKTLCLFDGVKN